MAKKKTLKPKEQVKIRFKELANGNQSIYLAHIAAIIHINCLQSENIFRGGDFGCSMDFTFSKGTGLMSSRL